MFRRGQIGKDLRMQRNMDLIRTILFALEEAPESDLGGWTTLEIEGHSAIEVSEHVRLLHESGLIDAQDASTMQTYRWHPQRLTWEGHEFLEAARNDSRWKRATDAVAEKGGGLTLDVLKALLIQYTRQAVLGG